MAISIKDVAKVAQVSYGCNVILRSSGFERELRTRRSLNERRVEVIVVVSARRHPAEQQATAGSKLPVVNKSNARPENAAPRSNAPLPPLAVNGPLPGCVLPARSVVRASTAILRA